MMEITLLYDPITRKLSTVSTYGGTTLDNISTRISVTGIPEGYAARLDFGVAVPMSGRKRKGNPYLPLVNGSCILTRAIMQGCKDDLRLPVQLVLRRGDKEIASDNTLVLRVSPSIGAMDTAAEIYKPDLSQAFMDVSESGGIITFTRLDGTTEQIRIDDDFLAWTDVSTVLPVTPTDDKVPTVKLVDDNYVRSVQAPGRILVTDVDGKVGATGPHIVDSWSPTPSDDNLATERLVKTSLDAKANDSEVVHNDVGTPAWSSGITYGMGATVVHNLTFYISQNINNLGHDPSEVGTVWWAKVTGSGGGEQEPAAYKVFNIGDGSSTSFNIAHGFNSYNVAHLMYRADGSMADVETTVERPNKDQLTVRFRTAPSANAYKFVAYRPGLGPADVVTSINGVKGDVEIVPEMFSAVSYAVQSLSPAEKAQARDNIGLGPAAVRNVGVSPGNLPVLGDDGKLANAVLPQIAISEYVGAVASVSQIVTLPAQKGDWASVTNDPIIKNNGAWMCNGISTQLTDWIQLSGPGTVTSVNGKTGAVTLNSTDVGAIASDSIVNNLTTDSATAPLSAGMGRTLDRSKVFFSPTLLSNPTEADLGKCYILTMSNGGQSAGNLYECILIGSTYTWTSRSVFGRAAYRNVGTGSDQVLQNPFVAGVAGQSLRVAQNGTSTEWYTPSSSAIAIFTGTITGNGTTTTFTVPHGLSKPPLVQITRDGSVVYPDITVTATNITITFNTAPANGVIYAVRGIA